MRTHKTKSLWFAYHQCAPPGTTAEALAEALIQCGLIEAVERDQWTGAVVRYAELPDLYRAGDGEAKERMVRASLKDLMARMQGNVSRG